MEEESPKTVIKFFDRKCRVYGTMSRPEISQNLLGNMPLADNGRSLDPTSKNVQNISKKDVEVMIPYLYATPDSLILDFSGIRKRFPKFLFFHQYRN